MRKIEFSRACVLARMSLKRGKLRFLIHEIIWEWARTAKIGVFSLENVWEWAQNTKNWLFSRVRSCENEFKTQKITFSHLGDYVRMSLKRENWRFLTRENLWEWAQNAENWVFSRVRSCENELKTREITFSHSRDNVRMSSNRKKWRFFAWERMRMSSKYEKLSFLAREILREWV